MPLLPRHLMSRLVPLLLTVALAGLSLDLFGGLLSWSAPGRSDYGELVGDGLPVLQLLALAYLADRSLRDLARWLDLPGMGPAVPKLAMQIATCLIYFAVGALILSLVFGKSISGLLAASGIAGLVIGLALRGLVSDVFSGIALNLDRSFRAGDFIDFQVRGQTVSGKLLEIQWRSTLLADRSENVLVIPNTELSTALITNRSRPNPATELACPIAVGSEHAPTRIMRILETVSARAIHEGWLLEAPKPYVRIGAIENGMVAYRLVFCIAIDRIVPRRAQSVVYQHAIEALHCAGITLHPARHHLYVPPEDPLAGRHYALEARIAILARVALLQPLSREELRVLAEGVRILRPAGRETVLAEGDHGDSMMVVVEGTLQVLVKSDDAPVAVGRLWPGDCFGELSLLTGQTRSATVVATGEGCLFEITKDLLAGVLSSNPELILRIGLLVIQRGNLTRAALSAGAGEPEEEDHATSLVATIRRFFHLGAGPGGGG